MKEPRLQDLLAPGWGGLDVSKEELAARQAESARKRLEVAHLFDAVFSTPDGERVLEHILDGTLRQPRVPVVVPGQQPVTPEQLVPHVAFRDGQDSVARLILDMIRQARAGRRK